MTHQLMAALLAVYGLGVVVGVLRTDASPGVRVGLALVWPLGPLAFTLTIGVLLVAAVVPLSRRLAGRA